MHRLRGNGQRLAGPIRPLADTVDVVLERPFDDVDDLLARMPVSDRLRLRGDLDAVLDQLAPRRAQVEVLEIGAVDAGICAVAISSELRVAKPASRPWVSLVRRT